MLTRVQTEILASLEAQGGTTSSAFRLIVCELGRSYWHGYMSLRRLEAAGLVSIHRKPGRPLTITLNRCNHVS